MCTETLPFCRRVHLAQLWGHNLYAFFGRCLQVPISTDSLFHWGLMWKIGTPGTEWIPEESGGQASTEAIRVPRSDPWGRKETTLPHSDLLHSIPAPCPGTHPSRPHPMTNPNCLCTSCSIALLLNRAASPCFQASGGYRLGHCCLLAGPPPRLGRLLSGKHLKCRSGQWVKDHDLNVFILTTEWQQQEPPGPRQARESFTQHIRNSRRLQDGDSVRLLIASQAPPPFRLLQQWRPAPASPIFGEQCPCHEQPHSTHGWPTTRHAGILQGSLISQQRKCHSNRHILRRFQADQTQLCKIQCFWGASQEVYDKRRSLPKCSILRWIHWVVESGTGFQDRKERQGATSQMHRAHCGNVLGSICQCHSSLVLV